MTVLLKRSLAITVGIAMLVASPPHEAGAKKSDSDEKQTTSASSTQTATGNGAAAEALEDNHDDLKEVAAVIEKSDKLVAGGEPDKAGEALRAAIKEHGQNPHLRERLSRAYYLCGDIDNAVSELLEAISLDSNVFDYYSGVAWLYSISGNHRDAVKYAKLALRLDPDKAYPYVVMGFSLGSLGKHAQAAETLRKAIELDPNSATAHFYLADVLLNDGDFKTALPLYQRALKLDPRTASAYVGLGDCFQKLGHKAEALAAYKRAVDLAPQDADARGHLGFALSQSGDYMGAMRHGMAANSIRLERSWGKFMGMFVAVMAGIFLLFGTIFGAMFMGSRFIPLTGESIINQFMLIFYKERPGRFVITDKRIVFVPEIVSRWFGATRVSIQREQINSIDCDNSTGPGVITVNSEDDSALLFRAPAMVYEAIVKALKEQGLIGGLEVEEKEEKPKEPAASAAPAVEEKDPQSDTAQFEANAIIAACYDFRNAEEQEQSSTQTFAGSPNPEPAAAAEDKIEPAKHEQATDPAAETTTEEVETDSTKEN